MAQDIIENTFFPLSDVFIVMRRRLESLSRKSVSKEAVGEKAYGLSCLPQIWTMPYFVISGDLYLDYKDEPDEVNNSFDCIWGKGIEQGLNKIELDKNGLVIVRSSSSSEGLYERGKYYSIEGRAGDIKSLIFNCLDKVIQESGLNIGVVHLIVQKLISPISAKGHLSNERRVYEESRDWLGEVVEGASGKSSNFEIHLRNWRQKINVDDYLDKKIYCNLSPHISEVLKIPAAWAYERNARLHFEWVWDGGKIYIVQADEEICLKGVNPEKIHDDIDYTKEYLPLVLKRIDLSHEKYNKIHNVFVYKELGIQIAPLYILEDKNEIEILSKGGISTALEKDIDVLVKKSLVIRVDLDTSSKSEGQLLPRTQELRDSYNAINWLQKTCCELKHSIDQEIVFIFHNFIPSISSAFAYSVPGERKVQIESLWGLPEGLYYNSHDKYVVDTKDANIDKLSVEGIADYSFYVKENYKHYFVKPDSEGHWRTEIVSPPHDWRRSIKKEKWIKRIAYDSRRISEREGKPLSIMWFIGVPREICEDEVMPWFHEHCDLKILNRARTERKKTPFDQIFVIKERVDIERLEKEIIEKKSRVKRIRIQPQDESLLRDKNTLKTIGEISKKVSAVIVLEGGILSHAYYQLMETNAIVEVIHPFIDVDEISEFNKLVRDKIFVKISDRGEVVDHVKLSGEFLLRALKNKLIEEALEVLDSKDQNSILEEIADVNEVIDAILLQLNVNKDVVENKQYQKRKKVGGFNDGLVLLKTKNIMPTKKSHKENSVPFSLPFDQDDEYAKMFNPVEIINKSEKVERWSDKRKYENLIQGILHLSVPLTRDSWAAKTIEMNLGEYDGSVIAEIKGKRDGTKMDIELSVFLSTHHQTQIDEMQLSLFE